MMATELEKFYAAIESIDTAMMTTRRTDAAISRDRAKIHELYEPDWKIWFDEAGDPRHGTPDDPRMVLIGVTVHAAEFLEVNKSQPVLLFELVKGWVTGTEPELGEMHAIKK